VTDTDHAAVYRSIRARVTDLVRDLPDEELDRIAPATPSWRVRDVVAHLAGNTADIVAGNLEGVASDPWTQAQVDARSTTPIVDVLDEWARCSAVVEPLIAGMDPMMRAMFLTDAVTHEHDVRGALGIPGARDTDAVDYAFRGVTRGIGAQLGDTGALRIVHDDGAIVLGEGEPRSVVTTSRFEVVRAAVGRRSYAQIEAWSWEGATRAQVLVLGRFTPPRLSELEE
jgi:uncharacterized protein (TIGR03083 family)